MKRVRLLLALGLLAASAVNGLGQQPQRKATDVSGVWELTSETPRGTMTRTATFMQDGSKLTGSIEMQRGPLEIRDGSVDGNKISFTLVMDRGGNTFEIVYTGTVDGDTAKGTFQTPRGEVPWSGKRVKQEP